MLNLKEAKIGHSESYPGWGFPQPTVIIDSQSAPALKGIESEQKYMRMYLMGGAKDTVVTDFEVDQAYLAYMKDILKLDLPTFVTIPDSGQGSLTTNILASEESQKQLGSLVAEGNRMQFFNLTQDELQLAEKLGNPTYADGKLAEVYQLGTKTGFREFCQTHCVPQAPGAICATFEEAIAAVHELQDGDVIIKSSEGTGGADLGSNKTITQAEIVAGNMDVISERFAELSPAEPPYVVEKKMNGLPEASLHIFLDANGKVVIEPTIFGQIAHNGSYEGGYFPDDFEAKIKAKVLALAQETIVPALQAEGLTGWHCMDFLYDTEQGEMFFIEDNTRPGALDFIAHFAERVVQANRPATEDFAWFHHQIPLSELGIPAGITFAEIQQVLGNLLNPNQNQFVLISNPDVLPHGYALHLTGVCSAEADESTLAQAAKQIHEEAINTLQSYYGHNNS